MVPAAAAVELLLEPAAGAGFGAAVDTAVGAGFGAAG
jgi:hypothetical protein